MELHANARLSVEGRRLLCRRVRELNWKVADAAFAGGISERRAYEWLARFDAGETLADRSSRPKSSPKKTPASVEAAIVRLRTLRKTASTIAAILQMAVSTVCAVLARVGLNRLSKLEPVEPANRYCRRHAGELIHLDIKTLGRFRRPGKRALGQGADRRSRKAGWEAVHVAVDDATRLSYVEVLPDQTAATTVGFLHRAIAWFARHGVIVQEVMTDNGSAYVSRLWAATCAEVGLVHIRTRPYRPRTNGKAERFIQTLLREWAYAATYRDSDHRRAVLPEWVRYYNTQRPHGSLGHKAPMTVLAAA
ncbi:IS481 family transposase [Microcella frigidaquae]|uniref:Transposase InsO family protein n=2 Tax=Microcella frigidaquae TaxID=424758 RepID=A0A840XHP5_9MICO|nr:IS481 family transposase [Microcella frigidaquae]MBB5616943.1 transposase InsO family protein [Microcella frigidaquae]MBB5617448.1 transposase InsO family protein [Microcella frigidaquae]MBB5617817.1 transposase InsO family protein [Microcella frigidaquae]MBB5617836.1 transposase InsO family protein [Microcella frigidaquae]MBB5617845.1 transposase InsO family protein [Microcella frigidaquae]